MIKEFKGEDKFNQLDADVSKYLRQLGETKMQVWRALAFILSEIEDSITSFNEASVNEIKNLHQTTDSIQYLLSERFSHRIKVDKAVFAAQLSIDWLNREDPFKEDASSTSDWMSNSLFPEYRPSVWYIGIPTTLPDYTNYISYNTAMQIAISRGTCTGLHMFEPFLQSKLQAYLRYTYFGQINLKHMIVSNIMQKSHIKNYQQAMPKAERQLLQLKSLSIALESEISTLRMAL